MNSEHAEVLEKGVEAWNAWRRANPDIKPDLADIDLSGRKLVRVNFSRVALPRANLEGCKLARSDLQDSSLIEANLKEADLVGCNLWNARLCDVDLSRARLEVTSLWATDLRRARLWQANLAGANLKKAVLDGASFSGNSFGITTFAGLDLSSVEGLETASHHGPSSIGVDTLSKSRGEIPEVFLRGCGFKEWEINLAGLYRSDLSPKEATDITYALVSARGGETIDFCSCFISYSHAEASLARRFHDQLQARGIRCWLDEYDLKPGDRILDVVDNAIRLHDKILLCCSKASLESWWVKDEIRKAQERERRDGCDIIIPLMVDRYLLDDWRNGMAADLRSRLAADFTGGLDRVHGLQIRPGTWVTDSGQTRAPKEDFDALERDDTHARTPTLYRGS